MTTFDVSVDISFTIPVHAEDEDAAEAVLREPAYPLAAEIARKVVLGEFEVDDIWTLGETEPA